MPPFERTSSVGSLSEHELQQINNNNSQHGGGESPPPLKVIERNSATAVADGTGHSPTPTAAADIQLCTSKPSSSSQQRSAKTPDDYYSITRNALDNCNASIQAFLECLSKQHGVSQASLNALTTQSIGQGDYLPVLQTCWHYATCFCDDEHESVMLLCLLVTAWESLHCYLSLQHEQAHRHYHMLRRLHETEIFCRQESSSSFTTGIKSRRSRSLEKEEEFVVVAEQQSPKKRGLRNSLRRRGNNNNMRNSKRNNNMSSSPNNNVKGPIAAAAGRGMSLLTTTTTTSKEEQQREQARKRKLELAEQCCTAMIGLYQTRQWQRRIESSVVAAAAVVVATTTTTTTTIL